MGLQTTQRLTEAVSAVCPVNGVAVGVQGDPATVRIDFAAGATAPQKQAAQVAVTSFDWTPAADQAWLDAKAPERTGLRQAASAAVANNTAFLAVASPTPAQAAAQLRALTQQNNRLIQRLVQLD